MHACELAIRAQLRIPDNRTVEQWILDQRIRPPGSARGTQMDLSLTPWLREPCEAVADNHNREVVIVAPTGAGKTTVLDASLLRATREDPGSILLAMQTDEDADAYYDERLEPMLQSLDGIGDMIRALPRGKRRKGELVLPHMTCFVVGAKMSAFQRKSVRYVFLDEVWQIKHGLVAEARGRHHDRWNARVVLTSQGGWQHVDTDNGRVKTELFEAWERTDRREWHFVCPECGTSQPWKWSGLKWADEKRADGSIDDTAITQSTHYQCATCETKFHDDIAARRLLANSGRYEAQNPQPLTVPGKHVGFHCNALTLYYVAWSTLVLEWKKASELTAAGDKSALQVFVQKRLAEFWKDEEDEPGVVLGGAGYRFADYANGEAWEGEVYRFMTIDRQRDHFWVVIRAWKSDGSSRMLWAGKVLTVDGLRELQLRMKVINDYTFEDAQYDTQFVYDDCVRFDSNGGRLKLPDGKPHKLDGWIGIHGSGDAGFVIHPRIGRPFKRIFSKLGMAISSSGGRARYLFFSNEGAKDILAKHRGGHAASWEIPDDAGNDWHVQINSEIKKDTIAKLTKQVVRRWVKIGSRPNHLWDCEVMQIVAALIKGVIAAPVAEAEKVVDVPAEQA
jgi:phage terminase large subunit GpA-like protein